MVNEWQNSSLCLWFHLAREVIFWVKVKYVKRIAYDFVEFYIKTNHRRKLSRAFCKNIFILRDIKILNFRIWNSTFILVNGSLVKSKIKDEKMW